MGGGITALATCVGAEVVRTYHHLVKGLSYLATYVGANVNEKNQMVLNYRKV